MFQLKTNIDVADHHRGNVNAAIKLIEYGDLQCPYCRRSNEIVNRLLEDWGSQVHFVFRNFPLREIHPNAFITAVTSEAAGLQGKFWEMRERIFENQNRITTDFLLSLAEKINLNLKQLACDSKSEAIKNKIKEDFESGIRSGVNRTPTFFLNGVRLATYNESYKSLLDAIMIEAESFDH